MLEKSERGALASFYLESDEGRSQTFKDSFIKAIDFDAYLEKMTGKLKLLESEKFPLGMTKFHLAAYCGWEIEGLSKKKM